MPILEYYVFDEENEKILKIDNVPEKICCFDCVYCPEGRTVYHEEKIHNLNHRTLEVKAEIEAMIEKENPDIILLEAKGEALFDKDIDYIIDVIHGAGKKVRLLSCGYILGKEEYRALANMADEVTAEIRFAEDAKLQRYQRPLQGITLENYTANIMKFRKQYTGRFIIETALFRGLNDSKEQIDALRHVIRQVDPDYVHVVTFSRPENVRKAFMVSDEVVKYASARLNEK